MTTPNRLAPRDRRARLLVPAVLALAPASVGASLGLFEHGSGVQSQAFGGITYAAAMETTSIASNPANLVAFAPRYDIGVNSLRPRATQTIVGNAAAADSSHDTDNGTYLFIPQGGVSWALSESIRVGMTIQSAGIGPEYKDSPFQRFGGAEESALLFSSSALSGAISYQLTPEHALGFALNVGYQTLEVKGVQFLGMISSQADRVSDNGTDGAMNIGFSIGWRSEWSNGLAFGAGYKSKSWAEKHDSYAGVVAGRGRLELPAIWGFGASYQLSETLLVAADYQRYEFRNEAAMGNRLSALNQGHLLGTDNGPGFGYRDLNAYKLGVDWKAFEHTSIKLGYVAANQMMQPSETLFGILGPVPTTTHYSLGLTTTSSSGFEFTGAVSYAPHKGVAGQNSIPEAFGGGETNVRFHVWSFGVSLGRPFE